MGDEIAYQNKDITSKMLAEQFKGKSFGVYGLDMPKIRRVLPTNIPTERESGAERKSKRRGTDEVHHTPAVLSQERGEEAENKGNCGTGGKDTGQGTADLYSVWNFNVYGQTD